MRCALVTMKSIVLHSSYSYSYSYFYFDAQLYSTLLLPGQGTKEVRTYEKGKATTTPRSTPPIVNFNGSGSRWCSQRCEFRTDASVNV
jgi:hypothetical protein